MRSFFIISTVVLSTLISFNSVAANVTVRWTGKVPVADCASNPISNQVAFSSQSKLCNIELKQSEITTSKHTATTKVNSAKKIVSFNI
ncbi:hypothetical protein [Vibrio chagasii]|uniref:hypothetical protein n=1 Tax=Vibrio chagasii TaxID=170679 RepID=UPI00406978C4